MSESSCLFCAIVAGDIASEAVLSTDLAYAFRDINPGAPTHVLVVPKEHITDAAALEPSHAAALSAVFARGEGGGGARRPRAARLPARVQRRRGFGQ